MRRVAGGVGRQAALALALDPQRQVGRAVPDQIAADLQVVVGTGGVGDAGARAGRARAVDGEMLPLAAEAGRVVEQVVVDENVAVGDRFVAAHHAGAPAAQGAVRGAGRAVAVAAAPAEDELQPMAAAAHPVEGVVGQQDVVAAVDAEARAFGVVDHVVVELDGVGLVVQPGGNHELEAGALAGGEAARAAVVDLVARHREIGRAPFEVDAPVLGVVDAAVEDVAVLHAHEVHRVVVAAADRAALDVDVVRLVDLERLLRLPAAAGQGAVADQQIAALLAVKDITGVFDAQPQQVEVIHGEDVHVAQQPRRARPIGAGEEDGELLGPVAFFPVVGQGVGGIIAGHQVDAVTGVLQGLALGDAPPRLADGGQCLVAAGAAAAIVAMLRVHPQLGQRRRADVVGALDGRAGQRRRRWPWRRGCRGGRGRGRLRPGAPYQRQAEKQEEG